MFHIWCPTATVLFGFERVCVVAVALCYVSTRPRRSWKHSLIFCSFLPTCFIFFSIQYDNLLQCCLCTWEKTHSVIFTNTVSAELATVSAHGHTHTMLLTSVCYCDLDWAVWSLPVCLPSFILDTGDSREIEEECLLWLWYAGEPVQLYNSRSKTNSSSVSVTVRLRRLHNEWGGKKIAVSEAKWIRSEFIC